jgi:two-component system, cell cycle sensor histidine kinase and response regulator CckA
MASRWTRRAPSGLARPRCACRRQRQHPSGRRWPEVGQGALKAVPITVLVVEDDSTLAEDLALALARMGYGVAARAASVEECMLAAEQHRPDVVLMDIGLQGELDGIDAARMLRERFDTPVVFLSGHADDKTMSRARDAGALGYLLKPFRWNELKSAVEVAIFRHQLERQLRDRERWLATTLRALGDAAIAIDAHGMVTFMNAAAEDLLGVREADARGRALAGLIHLINESTREPIENPLLQAFDEGEPSRLPHKTALVARGRELPVNYTVAPIDDGHGRLAGAVAVVEDLTEQRRAQQQIAVADRLSSLGAVAAGIAHEINNPLTYVCGNVEFLTTELATLRQLVSDESRPDRLQAVRDSLDNLEELVRDVRQGAADVSRIVRDLSVFARRDGKGQLCDVVERMQWALRVSNSAIVRHARIERIYRPVPMAGVDEGRLGQVFLNILLNAAYAMRDTERRTNVLTVTVEPEPDPAPRLASASAAGGADPRAFIRIAIADTGVGMTSDVLRRIFDPFFTTKPQGAGSGLGLAVCQQLVADMGGDISVTSEPGAGSCFVVRVPVAAPGAQRGDSEPGLAGIRGRVLVVDDDPGVLAVLRRMLAVAHEVVISDSAETALRILQARAEFDAIICDVMMPSMDGVAFYREIAASIPQLASRIVFLSGGAKAEQEAKFFSSIPNLALQKPPDARELLHAIETQLLASRRGTPAN